MKHNENQDIKIEIIKNMLKHKICYFIYCINGHNARLLACANTQRSSTHLRKKYDLKITMKHYNACLKLNSNIETISKHSNSTLFSL